MAGAPRARKCLALVRRPRSCPTSTSHVDEGEIVSVIGPNGAGKTTLFNLITGIYAPDDGDILLDGRSIAGLQPHQITRSASPARSRRSASS